MTREAELLKNIFEITRGDLDMAHFPVPQIQPIIDGVTFIRITRISRFWKTRGVEDSSVLLSAFEDFVGGLYSHGTPWVFMVIGYPSIIECWYGLSHHHGDTTALSNLLRGTLPDVQLDDTRKPDVPHLQALQHTLIVTGTPTQKVNRNQSNSDQIEKVCRGLFGTKWAFVVHGKPVPNNEVVRSLNQVADLIRNIQSTYLLKGSAIDEHNRTATRCVDLLETKLKRLEQGRTIGLWAINAAFFTDSNGALARAKALLHGAFSGEKSLPDPFRVCHCRSGSQNVPIMEPVTSAEAAVLARPPFEGYPGYEVVDGARFGVDSGRDRLSHVSNVLMLGEILDRGRLTGNALKLPFDDLTKHGLIVGVTGSGKTNTCFQLLDQIWDDGKGVPFLVVESAKSEYRSLLSNSRFAGLRVFTVGDETVSPLRINPFEVPRGIHVQTHIDYLKSLFSAAFVLYPPMPYVLEQCLQEIYEDRGWELARNGNRRGEGSERRFPSLTDLSEKIAVVVERMGYDERLTMDVKAGLVARINQLRIGGGKGLMFDTRASLEPFGLFTSPCVLELKQIVSDDEKAFLIGLVLIRLYEFHEGSNRRGGGKLVHLTLIEEAHRLLRNVSMDQSSEVSANPKGRAIEVFSNILSEIRAYGEGVLIAEQIPVKLTPDAIKNTNLKLVHRLVSEDDRKMVGSTMNLEEEQSRYLASMIPGEAVAYMEGMRQPVLLRVRLSPGKKRGDFISDDDIKASMDSFRRERANIFMPLPGCSRCESRQGKNGCGIISIGPTSDLIIRTAFQRLFNSIRLNPEFINETYSEFRGACSGARAQLLPGNEPYCMFTRLVDSELERRGEFWGWFHENVETSIELACEVMADLSSGGGIGENAGDTENERSNSLNNLTTLFNSLHRVDSMPFTGCHPCQEPCRYRYDMSFLTSDRDSRDFRSILMNPDFELDALGRLCWDITTQVFHQKDTKSRRGGALCFAVQQLGRMDITRTNQVGMASRIDSQLLKITEGLERG